MVWSPTLKSTARHFIAKNILAFIEANQTEALAWAKAQLLYAGDVPNFVTVFNSSAGRVVAIWPNLMLIRAGTATAEAPDDYSVAEVHDFAFELAIAHGDPDTLTALCEVYIVAVDSMLRNIPRASLITGMISPKTGGVICNVLAVDRDESRGGKPIFAQYPRITARVQMWEVS
jgi:hypothetical protein